MSGLLGRLDVAAMLRDYPMGRAFLEGPAALSRDALRALQERRFARVMERAWRVPFYRDRWTAAGMEPGDISGLDDLASIPSFSKDELMASVAEAPPFGTFDGRDSENSFAVFHTTSGTTGVPQPLFYGAEDREIQNLLLARAYRLMGLRDDDIVHSVYGFGTVNGGHYVREAVTHFTDALLVPAGTGRDMPSEQQVETMARLGATVLVGFGDYVRHLAETAERKGLQIPLRLVLGHFGRGDRQAVSDAWGGAAVYDWYGVGDTGVIAAESPSRNGLHIFEDAHLVEALDPETGAPVEDGHAGNLCATVLFKTGIYPIVRFDTKDLTTLSDPDAESGIGFRRMSGFEGPVGQYGEAARHQCLSDRRRRVSRRVQAVDRRVCLPGVQGRGAGGNGRCGGGARAERPPGPGAGRTAEAGHRRAGCRRSRRTRRNGCADADQRTAETAQAHR